MNNRPIITTFGDAATSDVLRYAEQKLTYAEYKSMCILHLAALVKYEREKESMNVRQLARLIGVNRDYIHDLERGKIWPEGKTRERLFGHLVGLKQDRDTFRRMEEAMARIFQKEAEQQSDKPILITPEPTPENKLAEEEETTPVETTKPTAEPPKPAPAAIIAEIKPVGAKTVTKHPFHVALYLARVASGMSQDELAPLLGVTSGALANWERDKYAPTKANYEKLCNLFPELAQHHKPASRDLPNQPMGSMTTDQPKAKDMAEPTRTATPSLKGALSALALLKKVSASQDAQSFLALLRMAEQDDMSVSELIALVGTGGAL